MSERSEVKTEILLTDDEEDIRTLEKFHLEKASYRTAEAENATETLRIMREKHPNLLILDLMLPDMSGLDVIRVLKSDEEVKDVPIIVVSAKGEELDVSHALDLGADDYITKPFSVKVFLARVNSVLRRCERKNANDNKSDVEITSIRGLVIDHKKHTVKYSRTEIAFSATEFMILEFLAKNSGQVFSRKHIMSAVKGEDYPATERSVDVQIVSIRGKLEQAGAKDFIETVRGVGYRVKEES